MRRSYQNTLVPGTDTGYTSGVTVGQGYLVVYALACMAADWLAGLVARAARRAPQAAHPIGVTMIRPVGGGTRISEDCLRSFLGQEYAGPLQFIVALQDPKDPALEMLQESKGVCAQVIVHPRREGFTGKISNLYSGVAASRHEILVFSDSDAWLPPKTVSRLVGVLESGAQVACCLPLHTRAENVWARVFALMRNSAMLHLWGPSVLLGRPAGAVGTTLAIRRSDLAALGGIEAFKAFVPEDIPLGRAARKAGMKIALGPPVYCPLDRVEFRELYQRLVRASMLVLTQVPGETVGGLACYAFAGAYLPLLAWNAFGGDPSILLLGAVLILAKVLAFWRLSAHAVGVAARPWDFLLVDLLYGAALLTALRRREAPWGDYSYRLEGDGKIRP